MPPASKAARISPESRPIAFTAVGVAALIYAGAFTTSFFGQAALAAHMAIPAALQYVVPIVIDLALVLFTLATLLRKTRGETTRWTNAMTAFWTTVSISANILHVLVPAGSAEAWDFATYTGAALAALMPLGALGASLVLENLLIEPPPLAAAVASAAAAEVREKRAATLAAAEIKAPNTDLPIATTMPDQYMEPPAGGLALFAATDRQPSVATANPIKRASLRPGRAATPSKSSADASQIVAQVIAHRDAKLTVPAIAAKVGKSESTVKRILRDARDAHQASETSAA